MQRKQKKPIQLQLFIELLILNVNRTGTFVLILIISASTLSFGQTDDTTLEAKVLFKDPGSDGLSLSTFYAELAPRTAFFSVDNKTTSFVQLEFGVQLSRKYNIGYYIATSPKTTLINVPAPGTPEYQNWLDSGVKLDQLPPGQTTAYLYFHHTGLNLGYMYKTHNILFPRAGMKIGRGTLEMTAEQKHLFQFFRNSILREKIWNLKPELGIGINLRPWWRFHADVGYQFVLDDDSEIINSGNFDGATFEIAFAFGAFNR